MAEWMSNSATYIIALIVTLGVLIAFHEFGHFWVARRLGFKVLKFHQSNKLVCKRQNKNKKKWF